MPKSISPNYHVDYMDVTQHWSPQSAQFAGGDALITFISNGWQVKPEVILEVKSFAEMRSVTIYHIELEREGQTIRLPVIGNPYVQRMVEREHFTIIEK